jgi:hypothetical protein
MEGCDRFGELPVLTVLGGEHLLGPHSVDRRLGNGRLPGEIRSQRNQCDRQQKSQYAHQSSPAASYVAGESDWVSFQMMEISAQTAGECNPFNRYSQGAPTMNRLAASIVLLALACAGVDGQEVTPSTPQPEHEWLKQFEGQWTSTSKMAAAPGKPAMECTGSMNSRMLGSLWVVNEMEADVSGFSFKGVQTIGYDPATKRYNGTWVDSMTNYLWRYEGTVDNSGKKLMLIAEGPNFMGDGKTAEYRDSYEFQSPDRILVTSEVKGSDGKWSTMMTGEMKRTK